MESSSNGGMPSAVTQKDEFSVAAICRNARLENTALQTRRKGFRYDITVLREKCKQIEDDYWRQYHLRLNAVGSDNGASIDQWISSFATEEGSVAKQTKQRLDELRNQIQALEVQLQKADDDLWGKWQGDMMRLATIPRPMPSLPALSQMSVQPSQLCSTARAASASHDVKHAMPPPSQPRRPSAPPSPAHPITDVQTTIATSAHAHRKILRGKVGPRLVVINPAMPKGKGREKKVESESPIAPAIKTGNAELLKPTYAASSPLAPPAFFPYGPPPANFATAGGQGGPQHTDKPIVVPESSQQPETVSKSIPTRRSSLPRQVDGSTSSSDPRHDATEVEDKNTSFQGVIDPKVGQIYKAYYKHEDHEGWWMCAVLPTLPAHESEAWARDVGITFTSPNLDLWHDAPKCYDLTISAKHKAGKWTKKHHVITGWHHDYRDDQPLVTERLFPVLFFEDRKGIQGRFEVPMPPKKFNFKPNAWDWVEAKNLRPVDAEVGPVYGTILADKFVKRLEALQKKGTTYSPESTPTDAPDQDGRPAKRLRIKVVFRKVHSTPSKPQLPDYKEKQEDSEMADAGSLSGDTIAASSTSLSDDELSKPLQSELPASPELNRMKG